jgi:hypothetical protein
VSLANNVTIIAPYKPWRDLYPNLRKDPLHFEQCLIDVRR